MLATLTHTRAPTRKAALVEHICQYLEGDRLRAVWQGLDDLQKAAVAEVVRSSGTAFPAERFRAKYGRLPDCRDPGLSLEVLPGHVDPLEADEPRSASP